MEAAQSAAQADIILIAAESPELPVEVQLWFEGWLPNRVAPDGALVLVQPSPNGNSQSLPLRSYLRSTAKRARLDYLRLSSPMSWAGLAQTVAGFPRFQPGPREFLGQDDLPLHWGINE